MFQQKFMSSEMMDSTLSGQEPTAGAAAPLAFGALAEARQRSTAGAADPQSSAKFDKRSPMYENQKPPGQGSRRSAEDPGNMSKHSANRGTQASLTASFDARHHFIDKAMKDSPTPDE